jgi:hypothetical protein
MGLLVIDENFRRAEHSGTEAKDALWVQPCVIIIIHVFFFGC